MDEGLLGTLQTYVLPHWPFVIMSFALGTMGQFFKKKVWTFERAKTSTFWRVMYTTLGIHAPLTGALLGALGAPASPGMDTWLERALYHFGSGAMASWTFAAWAHFMRSRGIVLAESIAPPPQVDAPRATMQRSGPVCTAVIGGPDNPERCGQPLPCRIHDRRLRAPDGAPLSEAPTIPPADLCRAQVGGNKIGDDRPCLVQRPCPIHDEPPPPIGRDK